MYLEPASESFELCVNSSLKITCTTFTTVILWTFIPNEENPDSVEDYVYTATSSLQDVRSIGNFVLRLESIYPLESTATLDEVGPEHNGSVLICANTALPNPKPEETKRITILVKGISYICITCMIQLFLIL